MTHQRSRPRSSELRRIFTQIMPQGQPTARKYQDKDIESGTRDTAANTDHRTIIS